MKTKPHMINTTRAGVATRRKGKSKRRESPFCVYADFAPTLPTLTQRRQILRLADSGLFPAYRRPAGPRSEPVFSKREVIDWYRQTFGDLFPDLVEQIEKDGFVKPSPHERGV